MNNTLPVIFGIEGTKLSLKEVNFFKNIKPAGFIIFSRNIETKLQLKALVDSLKYITDDVNIPILIDQEGGRVARLKPPLVKEYPVAAFFGELANSNLTEARQRVFKNYFEIGLDLERFGININCAPVADLLITSSHNIIGDRSFGSIVDNVVGLCEAAAYGLWAAGIQPILKHIPGHGHANVDSHMELPIIKNSLNDLESTDFKVFQRLNHLPAWAMTAHITYEAIDPLNCLTISKKGIDYIRNNLGFKDHLIITDDLSMKALNKTMGQNAKDALDAGCNYVLHCNGKFEEMVEISNAILEFKYPKTNYIEIHKIVSSIKIPKFYTDCL